MRRVILVTVAICVLALALPGAAMAAKPGTNYWPGNAKLQITVVDRYVTLNWPAISGPEPVGYYGVMVWERHQGDDGFGVGLATSYTFPNRFNPGMWCFKISALSPENVEYDSITGWVKIE